MLFSIFNLAPDSDEKGRSAVSFRAAREKKKQRELEQAWQGSLLKSEDSNWKSGASMEKFAEWLEKGKGHGKDGLLSQTILEEEDDSDAF